jgi:hypothetical protein
MVTLLVPLPILASPAPRERVAVIDLGAPGSSSGVDDVGHKLQVAIVAAGFDPVIGDGVEDALAGRDVERDAVELAAALAAAQRAFGALSCGDVTPQAKQAIGLAAARQAAGLPAPELARAWTYLLLCADRENRVDAALIAGSQLRQLGGSPDVPASIWAKYPQVDAVANVDLVELDIDTDTVGAAVWIDSQRVGVSPVHVALPAGEHVIAAAAGSRRGWAAGTAVRSQKSVHVPLAESAGPWSDLAKRIAGWNGKRVAPDELAWVLARVHARVALVRRGDTISAWGQIGRSEAPHSIGGDDGVAPVADVERVLGLIADRVHTWSDHAPDPDRPLLVESSESRDARGDRKDAADRPTKWWVYAAIAGAAAIAATIIIVHDTASDRQRVELHYP